MQPALRGKGWKEHSGQERGTPLRLLISTVMDFPSLERGSEALLWGIFLSCEGEEIFA